MMKRRYGTLLAAAMTAMPAVAQAGTTPSGFNCIRNGNGTSDGVSISQFPFPIPLPGAAVRINGITIGLGECLTTSDNGKTFSLNASFFAPGGSGNVSALYNTDPFITFSQSTSNAIAGPVTYDFLFSTPITPGFYGSAFSTGGVTVTGGPSGVAVDNSATHPTFISGYGTLDDASTNLGVDIGTDPCSDGAFATETCDQGTASNSFAPAFYNNLEALLTYEQTGLGSQAGWTGAIVINAVPEPASIALVATGVLLIGGIAARRRRA